MIGGETDLPRVREIQQSYVLQPLSTGQRPRQPPPPAIEWPTWTEGDETREAYRSIDGHDASCPAAMARYTAPRTIRNTMPGRIPTARAPFRDRACRTPSDALDDRLLFGRLVGEAGGLDVDRDRLGESCTVPDAIDVQNYPVAVERDPARDLRTLGQRCAV